jgi:hypothetical protein
MRRGENYQNLKASEVIITYHEAGSLSIRNTETRSSAASGMNSYCQREEVRQEVHTNRKQPENKQEKAGPFFPLQPCLLCLALLGRKPARKLAGQSPSSESK